MKAINVSFPPLFRCLFIVALLFGSMAFRNPFTVPEENQKIHATDTVPHSDININIDVSKILERVNQALQSINLDKIMADVQESLQKIDFNKIQTDVQQSLKQIDFEKMQKDIDASLKNIDWKMVN